MLNTSTVALNGRFQADWLTSLGNSLTAAVVWKNTVILHVDINPLVIINIADESNIISITMAVTIILVLLLISFSSSSGQKCNIH